MLFNKFAFSQSTAGPIRPELETDCNQNILYLTTVSKPGRIRLQYPGKKPRESVLAK